MNDNQKVFEAVTGFKASYIPCGASQDYDESSEKEILDVVTATVENADMIDLDIDSSEVDINKVSDAIVKYHSCDSGSGNDLDIIFNSLDDE